MSNQKRLSQLSLAAIALLAAALPCLAQTEANNRPNAINKTQATEIATEIATLRNDRVNVRTTETKTTSEHATAKATSAARDKFNAAITEATSSTSGFGSKATLTESDWQKTQSLSKRSESESSKSITFVPSRGQKLPK